MTKIKVKDVFSDYIQMFNELLGMYFVIFIMYNNISNVAVF